MVSAKKPQRENEDRKRLAEARQNLEKIQKKIAPFTKPQRFIKPSGVGEWSSSSCFELGLKDS